MIEVTNLTKRYAGRTALSGISFSVGKGEIAGLLGPNGAGKSTTMRILSCYMPASSGTARIGGLDVFKESQEARRRLEEVQVKLTGSGLQGDRLRVVRAVEILEFIGMPQGRDILQALAGGAPESLVTTSAQAALKR